MKNIMGRESASNQCYECANCGKSVSGYGSSFHCEFLDREFRTWHYDVPNECPCKGRGWWPKKGEEK